MLSQYSVHIIYSQKSIIICKYMKLTSMMISIFIKDSVLTTQSRTDIIDLEPKRKEYKNIFNEQRICFVLQLVAIY